MSRILPHIQLRFYDTRLRIESDAPTVIDLARRTYARFAKEPEPHDGGSLVVCQVAPDRDGASEQIAVTIDGRRMSMPRRTGWEGDVCDWAVEAAFARSQDHAFVHAASANLAGQGLLLVGHAHHGKTTLALALARRGFGFLGDDIASLDRVGRRLYPFPKSVRLWPDDLPGHLRAGDGADLLFWAGKYVLDVEKLYPNCVGAAAPLSHIVLLRDPQESLDAEQDGAGEPTDVLLDRDDPSLRAHIQSLALGPVRTYTTDSGKSVLRLRTADRQRLATSLRARCAETGVELLWVGRRLDVAPSFAGPARLRAIPRAFAARTLLQHLRGPAIPGDAADTTASGASRLFLDLAQTVAHAECYALTLGSLDEMVELIVGLAGSS